MLARARGAGEPPTTVEYNHPSRTAVHAIAPPLALSCDHKYAEEITGWLFKQLGMSRRGGEQSWRVRIGLAMRLAIVPQLLKLVAPAIMAVSGLQGQTLIDLRTQSKTVDFTSAPSTKPVKAGTSLPATCTAGEAFLKTDAMPGKGLYWCTSANTWTQQNPNSVDKTQATSYTSGARQTFQPSAGTAGLRIGPGALPSTGLAGDLAVDASDAQKLKVYDGNQWVTSGGGDTVTPGVGITISGSSPKQVGVDTAAVPAFLTASATVDFPSVGPGSCQEMSISLPGAATGDAVAAGWPVLATGLVGFMQVTSPNAVAVRLCNLSGTSVDPPNNVFRATIVRGW
jgi:hypothetical protein